MIVREDPVSSSPSQEKKSEAAAIENAKQLIDELSRSILEIKGRLGSYVRLLTSCKSPVIWAMGVLLRSVREVHRASLLIARVFWKGTHEKARSTVAIPYDMVKRHVHYLEP